MPAVQAVNAEWVAVIPYAFTMPGRPTVSYNHSTQWWGERPEGVTETIYRAHTAGLKVMLKPQVFVPGDWPGGLDFTDAEWELWEADYTRYLMPFVEIADSIGVEMICIGTEFTKSETQREQYWRDLIARIRVAYDGELTYAANWDTYRNTPFWDALDYIGVDAYFPLSEAAAPSVDTLLQAWRPYALQMAALSERVQKPILFTEWGYLSVKQAAWRTWELEANVRERSIDEQAQAQAYEAIFRMYGAQPWWRGGFVWKWFPNGRGGEGYNERDYTPQGKAAEAVLRRWYE